MISYAFPMRFLCFCLANSLYDVCIFSNVLPDDVPMTFLGFLCVLMTFRCVSYEYHMISYDVPEISPGFLVLSFDCPLIFWLKRRFTKVIGFWGFGRHET